MKKKIYLAGLAAGILLAMLPAGTVKASEKQTTEEYYYQLLLSGAYPYNTAANAGGLNTAAGLPAGSWEQIVALANQQLTQDDTGIRPGQRTQNRNNTYYEFRRAVGRIKRGTL